MTVTYSVQERSLTEEERRTLAALLMRQGKLSKLHLFVDRPDLGRAVIRNPATAEARQACR